MFKLALPNKGRLAAEVFRVLEGAGYSAPSLGDRSLVAKLGDDLSALLVRAEDVPAFVADGAADFGITGWDCVLESGLGLESRTDLGFGTCRLVVAAKADSEIAARGVAAVSPKSRVATSFPRLTEQFFSAQGIEVTLVHVSGAAEVTPQLGVADLIVDLVATGSTLRTNGLVEVCTIATSTARLVSRPLELLPPPTAEMARDLALSLESVIRARGQRYLMANVPRSALPRVRELLPGISGPTIVEIAGKDSEYVAAHAVVPERAVNRLVLELKNAGGTGILVTRIERLIP